MYSKYIVGPAQLQEGGTHQAGDDRQSKIGIYSSWQIFVIKREILPSIVHRI